MVRRHHWCNGHEFEQTPGDSEGQGFLVSCSSWDCRVRLDLVTEQQQQSFFLVLKVWDFWMFIAPIILLPFNIIMHYVRSYIFILLEVMTITGLESEIQIWKTTSVLNYIIGFPKYFYFKIDFFLLFSWLLSWKFLEKNMKYIWP